MITVFFVFTAAMVIMASFSLVGAMLGNGVTLPSLIPEVPVFEYLTPTNFLIMYPSTMFQVWYWADKLGVLT